MKGEVLCSGRTELCMGRVAQGCAGGVARRAHQKRCYNNAREDRRGIGEAMKVVRGSTSSQGMPKQKELEHATGAELKLEWLPGHAESRRVGNGAEVES